MQDEEPIEVSWGVRSVRIVSNNYIIQDVIDHLVEKGMMSQDYTPDAYLNGELVLPFVALVPGDRLQLHRPRV